MGLINQVNNIKWESGIRLIPDSTIDCVITDPPYGIQFQSNHRHVKHDKILNDDNLNWIDEWIIQLKRVCKSDAHLYIFCSWHNVDIFKQQLQKQFNVKNILIWDKTRGGMGDLTGDYRPRYEMILFLSDGSKDLNGQRQDNIIRTVNTTNDLHPTEKPINLIRFLMEKSTQKDDIILDTFAGSFSTAKAAISCGRKFICFESDERYCKSAEYILSTMNKSLF